MLPLPLTTLIKQLRAAGFSLDPGREMQLRRVVHERGKDYVGRFGEMKYLLAPFVALRPEEQRNFYAFWDRYVTDLEAKLEANNDEEKDESGFRFRAWHWLLLPLLAGLLFGAYRFFNPAVAVPKGERHIVKIGLPDVARDTTNGAYIWLTEGDTLRLRNRTRGRLNAEDSTGFRWRVENAQTGSEEYVSRDFDLDMARPLVQGEGLRAILVGDHLGLKTKNTTDTVHVAVQCANPPELPEITVAEGVIRVGATHSFAIAEPVEGLVYDWEIEGRGMQGTAISHAFSRDGSHFVTVRAIRGGLQNIELCATEFPIRVEVMVPESDLPILASEPLLEDEPRVFATHSTAFKWGKWLGLFFLFFPIALWKYREFQASRREKTDEEIAEAYPIFDQGPYNVPYRSRNDQISVPADFYRIADQLRVREEAELRVFDGAATIEATVNSGGFPSWRERNVQRPADYLILVTHNDEFNQQDLLLKRLTDFLSAREAAITVYYHEGQFEHFWNKEYPKGWSPDRLYDRYQQYRLLILGNAHGLVDAYATKQPRLYPSKEAWFGSWARRLVLTTEPSADWTAQEVLLYRAAHLYPITLRGLNEGIRTLNATEEYEAEDFRKWRTLQQRTNPEPSARYRKWETVGDHEDYLRHDPDMLRWLRGLAVTGNPDWNLTIAIGRALDIDVTHDRLLQLSRIPWLAGNRPDHDLRFALLARINAEDEAKARAAVVKELELVKDSVKGSFAQTEWQTNLAVHQLHLAPAAAPQKTSLREMIRAGLFTTDQLRDLERAAQRKEQPEAQAQTKAGPPPPRPGSLDRLLAKDDRQWKDTRSGRLVIGAIAVATLAILLALSLLAPERELEAGEAIPWWAKVNVVDDAALEANNEAVAIWQQTDTSIKNQEGEISIDNATALNTINSKLKTARELRDGAYPLAETNEHKAFFNAKAYRLNAAYLDLSADAELAFRDLIEEDNRDYLAPISPDEKLWVDYIHQDGLAVFGLHQALTNKYPLDAISQLGVDQLKKKYAEVRFTPAATNGYFIAEGRLPNGQQLGELRTERDSLLNIAATILENIESLTSREYFDSLSVLMPVNLRTLVEELRGDEAVGNATDDIPGVQNPVEEPVVNDPVQNQPPTSEPSDIPQAVLARANSLIERFNGYRYNQTINFETSKGDAQRDNLKGLLELISANASAQNLLFAIDRKTLSSGRTGLVYDGKGHNDAGLILARGGTDAQNWAQADFLREVAQNSYVLMLSTFHAHQPSVPPAPNLVRSVDQLARAFSALGFGVNNLKDPTLADVREAMNKLSGSGLNERSQLIIIVNFQVTDEGEILLGQKGARVETLPVEDINTLQMLTEQAGHSLLVGNYLTVGDLNTKPTEIQGGLAKLSAAELMSLLRKNYSSDAVASAEELVKQANDTKEMINRLIESLAERSGGYSRGRELLYPDDKAAVEYEFIKGSSGNSVERAVRSFGNALSRNYAKLNKTPQGAGRVAQLTQRFSASVLKGGKWDVGTFKGKTVTEAIPVLEAIIEDVQTAEKAYLLALADSLGLGEK